MESDSEGQRIKSKEKNSSLHQTKARYLQVIQDLTKDHQSVLQEKAQNTNSQIKPISKSCSSVDLYNGNNSSAIEETPEEIKQYVKQFKAEVEEKFKKSEVNKQYVFPKHGSYDKISKNGTVDTDLSLESLEKVSRYDLNSQNIKKKYGISKTQAIISGDIPNETGQLAEFLHDIGQLDKQYLESQLRDNKSNILKILCNTLRKKIIDTERSQDSLENQLEQQLQAKNQANNLNLNSHKSKQNANSSSHKITDKIDNKQSSNAEKYEKTSNQNSRGVGKENKIIDYEKNSQKKFHDADTHQQSPNSHQNIYDLVEDDDNPQLSQQYHTYNSNYHQTMNTNHEKVTKSAHSNHNGIAQQQRSLEKISTNDVLTYTDGINYASSFQGLERQDSNKSEEIDSGKNIKQKNNGNLQSNLSAKNYASPRKKASTGAHAREAKDCNNQNTKRSNQVSSRVKAHYYNKNVISPHRTQQSNSKQQNLSKKSNLTIFTNNTLTSTLSPKSNMSLSTFKSNSKGKTCKASQQSGKKSLLQFQVGSNVINKLKKMDDRQTCMSPQALNGPIKSRIASKITAKILKPKKAEKSMGNNTNGSGNIQTNPILTVDNIKSINTSIKNSRYSSKSRRLNSGHNEIIPNYKNSMNGSSYMTKDQALNIAYKANLGYLSKKSSDRETNKGKAMLNKLFPQSQLPQSHQKNILSLSSANWKKRLENFA